MKCDVFSKGQIVYGINWVRLQEESAPDFLIEYEVLNCTPRSITVQWQRDHRPEQGRYYWGERFHATRQEAHALARIWLEKEIEKRSREVAKLKGILNNLTMTLAQTPGEELAEVRH